MTFSSPQSWIRVKLTDDVPKPSPNKSAPQLYRKDLLKQEAESGGKKMRIPKDMEMVHWEGVFNLNGGTRLKQNAKVEEEKDNIQPFFIDCRRKQNLRLEVSVEVDRVVKELKKELGPGEFAQEMFNATMKKFLPLGWQPPPGFSKLPDYISLPLSIDATRPMSVYGDAAVQRKAQCKRQVCSPKMCPPLGTEPRSYAVTK